MAVGTITVQQSLPTGIDITGQAATATDGDKFLNDRNVCLIVNNGSGGSINATISTPGTYQGLPVDSLVVAVPAGKIYEIGPFPTNPYEDSDGFVTVVCSSVTSVKIAAVKR